MVDCPDCEASMGPRSCDRGKGSTVVDSHHHRGASMGPRSCDRGKADSPVGRRREGVKLQWGRGRVTAESVVTLIVTD